METILAALPIILLLAICPLLMAFMMRGGHEHASHAQGPESRSSADRQAQIHDLETQIARLKADANPSSSPTTTQSFDDGAHSEHYRREWPA